MYVKLAYFWPLITRCPLSIWPDFGRVWVETDGFLEVLAWRKMVGSYTGEAVFAEKLAEHFGTLQKLMIATEDELSDVREIGGRIASSVVKYFSQSNHQSFISRLVEAGLQTEIIMQV